MTDAGQLLDTMVACVLRKVGQGDGLIIAVLGPEPSDDHRNIAGWKRNQIREALKNDGHRPFFPEDCTWNDPTLPSLLQQEVLLMGSATVDLLILLHTESGSGTLQEIGKFDSYPEIIRKTRVLFPFKFFTLGATYSRTPSASTQSRLRTPTNISTSALSFTSAGNGRVSAPKRSGA